MKKITLFSQILFVLVTITSSAVYAQVKIGDNASNVNESAVLEVESTAKGFLPPRLDIPNLNQPAPVTNPAKGLMAYNTNTSSGEGLVYWDGTVWRRFQQSIGSVNMSVHAAGSVYVGDIGNNPSSGLAVQPGSQGIESITWVSGWLQSGNNIAHAQWRVNFKNQVPAGKSYYVILNPRSAVVQASAGNQGDADNDLTTPIVVGKDQTGFKIFCQESFGSVQQLLFDIVVLVEN